MLDTRWMKEREREGGREGERETEDRALLLKVPRSIDRAFLIWLDPGIDINTLYFRYKYANLI